MAQHLLHGPQVGAALEQVGGEGVAEGVGGDVVRKARLPRVALDDGVKPWRDSRRPRLFRNSSGALRVPGAAQERAGRARCRRG